jgi:allantoinase
MTARDLVGYADHPPVIDWPGGARLAVNFVLNVEEGAEYSILDGDGRSESGAVRSRRRPGARGRPRPRLREHVRVRRALRRLALLRLFRERDLPLTVFAAAQALERNPAAAAAIAATDWDVVAHGYRWAEHYLMDEATERAQIARAHASLARTTGRAPEGWYCRYAPSSPAPAASSPSTAAFPTTATATPTSCPTGPRSPAAPTSSCPTAW